MVQTHNENRLQENDYVPVKSLTLLPQSSIPSTKEGAKPSRIPMMRGVYFAYGVVAACYFPVAITGYWAFGNLVQDNILKSVGRPTWVVAMANLMVVVHVFASYQVTRGSRIALRRFVRLRNVFTVEPAR